MNFIHVNWITLLVHKSSYHHHSWMTLFFSLEMTANDLSTGQLMDSSTFVFSFQLLKACIHLHQCIRLAHAWLTNCNASFQRDKLLEDKPSSSSIPMKLSYTSLIHEHPFWYNLISQHTRACGLLTGFTRGRRHLFKILPQEQMRYEGTMAALRKVHWTSIYFILFYFNLFAGNYGIWGLSLILLLS